MILDYYTGPMVYGAAYCPLLKKEHVKDLGVAGTELYLTQPV